MFRRLILPFLLNCCIASAAAQNGYGPMDGYVEDHNPSENSSLFKSLPGAVVECHTPADTLYTTTNDTGYFRFKQVPAGWVSVRVSYLGYKPFVQDSIRIINRFGIKLPLLISLEPELQKIEDVVIEGEAELMTRSGDTIIYNAAAVRTMAGDEAIRILEQMPGITIDEFGQITILGEQLARTYVNGRLLFGDSPTTALNNLLAEEVVKMKVYHEPTDETRRSGRKRGRTQQVLDIQTREPIVAVINGHFLASYGADFEPTDGHRQQRYGVGATGNFFSEKLLMMANVLSNNIGRISNRMQDMVNLKKADNSYTERHYADVNLTKIWGADRISGQKLDAGYTYENTYMHTGSHTLRNYFAADGEPAHIYADTLASHNGQSMHNARFNLSIHPGGRHELNLINNFDYATPDHTTQQFITSGTEQSLLRAAVLQQSGGRQYSLSNRLDWSWNAKNGPSIETSLGSSIGESSRSGWRIDTLSADKRVLEVDGEGPRRKFSGEIHLGQTLLNNEVLTTGISANYELIYERYRQRQTAINTYDPTAVIDPTNTYNYTYNYTTHNASVSAVLQTNIFQISAGLNVQSARLNKDEYYPEALTYGQRFTSFLPELVLTSTQGVYADFFTYQASATLPSVEQLRDRLDNSNPLLLQAGNPNLKQSIRHELSFSIPKAGPGMKIRAATAGLNATFCTNDIVSRSHYFAQATRLDKWGYTAPAGSTLYTYENTSGAMALSGWGSFSQRIKAIRTNLYGTLVYRFSRQPAYIGELKNMTYTHQPSLKIGLRGTQSRQLRLNVASTTAYVFARNTQSRDSRYLRQSLTSEVEIRFLKKFFANAVYMLNFCHFFSDRGSDTTTQLLNAVVGCNFAGNKGSLSIAGYDLLNRGSDFTVTTLADYELRRWQPSFGRYFTVNIAFKFNKTRKPATAPGMLNDGMRFDAFRTAQQSGTF